MIIDMHAEQSKAEQSQNHNHNQIQPASRIQHPTFNIKSKITHSWRHSNRTHTFNYDSKIDPIMTQTKTKAETRVSLSWMMSEFQFQFHYYFLGVLVFNSNQITSNAAISKKWSQKQYLAQLRGNILRPQSNQTYQTNISQSKVDKSLPNLQKNNTQIHTRTHTHTNIYTLQQRVRHTLSGISIFIVCLFGSWAFILLLINLILLRAHSSANLKDLWTRNVILPLSSPFAISLGFDFGFICIKVLWTARLGSRSRSGIADWDRFAFATITLLRDWLTFHMLRFSARFLQVICFLLWLPCLGVGSGSGIAHHISANVRLITHHQS